MSRRATRAREERHGPMLSTTTTEHEPLVVAAPAGHHLAVGDGVASTRYRAMCDAFCATSCTVDRRTEPAVFGTWNHPRRLMGFVT